MSFPPSTSPSHTQQQPQQQQQHAHDTFTSSHSPRPSTSAASTMPAARPQPSSSTIEQQSEQSSHQASATEPNDSTMAGADERTTSPSESAPAGGVGTSSTSPAAKSSTPCSPHSRLGSHRAATTDAGTTYTSPSDTSDSAQPESPKQHMLLLQQQQQHAPRAAEHDAMQVDPPAEKAAQQASSSLGQVLAQQHQQPATTDKEGDAMQVDEQQRESAEQVRQHVAPPPSAAAAAAANDVEADSQFDDAEEDEVDEAVLQDATALVLLHADRGATQKAAPPPPPSLPSQPEQQPQQPSTLPVPGASNASSEASSSAVEPQGTQRQDVAMQEPPSLPSPLQRVVAQSPAVRPAATPNTTLAASAQRTPTSQQLSNVPQAQGSTTQAQSSKPSEPVKTTVAQPLPQPTTPSSAALKPAQQHQSSSAVRVAEKHTVVMQPQPQQLEERRTVPSSGARALPVPLTSARAESQHNVQKAADAPQQQQQQAAAAPSAKITTAPSTPANSSRYGALQRTGASAPPFRADKQDEAMQWEQAQQPEAQQVQVNQMQVEPPPPPPPPPQTPSEAAVAVASTEPIGQSGKAKARRRTELNSEAEEAASRSGATPAAEERQVKRRKSARKAADDARSDAGSSTSRSVSTPSSSRKAPSSTKEQVAQKMCGVCSKGSKAGKMVQCEDCDDDFHFHCLKPQLKAKPKGAWYCTTCTASRTAAAEASGGTPRHSAKQKYSGSRQLQRMELERQLRAGEKGKSTAQSDEEEEEEEEEGAASETETVQTNVQAEASKDATQQEDSKLEKRAKSKSHRQTKHTWDYVLEDEVEAKRAEKPLPPKRNNRPAPSPAPPKARSVSARASVARATPQRGASVSASKATPSASATTPTAASTTPTAAASSSRIVALQASEPDAPASSSRAASPRTPRSSVAPATPSRTRSAMAKESQAAAAAKKEAAETASAKRKRMTRSGTQASSSEQPETPSAGGGSAATETRSKKKVKRELQPTSSEAQPIDVDAVEQTQRQENSEAAAVAAAPVAEPQPGSSSAAQREPASTNEAVVQQVASKALERVTPSVQGDEAAAELQMPPPAPKAVEHRAPPPAPAPAPAPVARAVAPIIVAPQAVRAAPAPTTPKTPVLQKPLALRAATVAQPGQAASSAPAAVPALVTRAAAASASAQEAAPRRVEPAAIVQAATPSSRSEPEVSIRLAPASSIKRAASTSLDGVDIVMSARPASSPNRAASSSLEGVVLPFRPASASPMKKGNALAASTLGSSAGLPFELNLPMLRHSASAGKLTIDLPGRSDVAASPSTSKQLVKRASTSSLPSPATSVLAAVEVSSPFTGQQEAQSSSSAVAAAVPRARSVAATTAARSSSQPSTPRSSSVLECVVPRPTSQLLSTVTITTGSPSATPAAAASSSAKPKPLEVVPVISAPAPPVSTSKGTSPAHARSTPAPSSALASVDLEAYRSRRSASVVVKEATPSAKALGKRKAAPVAPDDEDDDIYRASGTVASEAPQPASMRPRRAAAVRAGAAFTAQFTPYDADKDLVEQGSPAKSARSNADSTDGEEMDVRMESEYDVASSDAEENDFQVIITRPTTSSRAARSSSSAAAPASAEAQALPVAQDAEPMEVDAEPSVEQVVPAVVPAVPVVDEAPALDDAPAINEAPVVDEAVPIVQDEMPIVEEDAPASQPSAPSQQQVVQAQAQSIVQPQQPGAATAASLVEDAAEPVANMAAQPEPIAKQAEPFVAPAFSLAPPPLAAPEPEVEPEAASSSPSASAPALGQPSTSKSTSRGGGKRPSKDLLALDYRVDLPPRKRSQTKKQTFLTTAPAETVDDPECRPDPAPPASKKKSTIDKNSRLQAPTKKDFDEARYMHNGVPVERQVATCKHKRYTGWSKCSSCRQPKQAQICRFLDMRVFYVDPEANMPYTLEVEAVSDSDSETVVPPSSSRPRSARAQTEAPAKEREKTPPPPAPFFASETRTKRVEYKSPDMYNVPIDEASRRQIKLVAAEHLIPRLEEEVVHEQLPKCLRRLRGLTEAMTCDLCATSLFSSSFFCELCGGEFCRACFKVLESLEPGTGVKALVKCLPGVPNHTADLFLPITRFEEGQLERELKHMKEVREEDRLAKAAAAELASKSNTSAEPSSASHDASAVDGGSSINVTASSAATAESPSIRAPHASTAPGPSSAGSSQGEASTSSAAQAIPIDGIPAFAIPRHHEHGSPGEASSNLCNSLCAAMANSAPAAPHAQPQANADTLSRSGLNANKQATVVDACDDPTAEEPPAVPAAATQESRSSRSDASSTRAASASRSSSASFEKAKRPKGRPDIPSHTVSRHHKDELTEELFLETWSKGEPLVIEGVTLRKAWDPARFISMYGDEECEITTCEDDDSLPTTVTVREFFETFGLPRNQRRAMLGKGTWKLKDWPPQSSFAKEFPELNQDFNDAVPMPDYTRRDGRKNISAMFPENANAPDLGPKMYNAWPGKLTAGGHGSTRLHMDVADAINIMLHVADSPSGVSHRVAAWDLFRAKDSPILRMFLREKFDITEAHLDPIHSQRHYLTEDLLAELWEKHGIKPWRVYQREGEAVVIPAGCAHQVCNLTDCIKVAVDFISPQNVARCFQLTKEFSDMVYEDAASWKEDILQLQAQLWYAWLACRTYDEPTQPEKWGKPKPVVEEKEAQELRGEKRKRREENKAKAKMAAAANAAAAAQASSGASTSTKSRVPAPPSSVLPPGSAAKAKPSKSSSGRSKSSRSKADPKGPAWLIDSPRPELRSAETNKSSTAPSAKAPPATAAAPVEQPLRKSTSSASLPSKPPPSSRAPATPAPPASASTPTTPPRLAQPASGVNEQSQPQSHQPPQHGQQQQQSQSQHQHQQPHHHREQQYQQQQRHAQHQLEQEDRQQERRQQQQAQASITRTSSSQSRALPAAFPMPVAQHDADAGEAWSASANAAAAEAWSASANAKSAELKPVERKSTGRDTALADSWNASAEPRTRARESASGSTRSTDRNRSAAAPPSAPAAMSRSTTGANSQPLGQSSFVQPPHEPRSAYDSHAQPPRDASRGYSPERRSLQEPAGLRQTRQLSGAWDDSSRTPAAARSTVEMRPPPYSAPFPATYYESSWSSSATSPVSPNAASTPARYSAHQQPPAPSSYNSSSRHPQTAASPPTPSPSLDKDQIAANVASSYATARRSSARLSGSQQQEQYEQRSNERNPRERSPQRTSQSPVTRGGRERERERSEHGRTQRERSNQAQTTQSSQRGRSHSPSRRDSEQRGAEQRQRTRSQRRLGVSPSRQAPLPPPPADLPARPVSPVQHSQAVREARSTQPGPSHHAEPASLQHSRSAPLQQHEAPVSSQPESYSYNYSATRRDDSIVKLPLRHGIDAWTEWFLHQTKGEQRRIREETLAKNPTVNLALDGLPSMEGVFYSFLGKDRDFWKLVAEEDNAFNEKRYLDIRARAVAKHPLTLQSAQLRAASAIPPHSDSSSYGGRAAGSSGRR